MLCFGLDVVDIGRVERALERWGSSFLGRILADSEAAWCGDDVRRVAACLAVKEGAVKAIGRRPLAFGWADVRLCTPPARPPRDVFVLVEALKSGAALTEVMVARCTFHGSVAGVFVGAQGWAGWGECNDAVRSLTVCLSE